MLSGEWKFWQKTVSPEMMALSNTPLPLLHEPTSSLLCCKGCALYFSQLEVSITGQVSKGLWDLLLTMQNGISLLHSVWEHHTWASLDPQLRNTFLLTSSRTSYTSRKGGWRSWACLVWQKRVKEEVEQMTTTDWRTMINMMEPNSFQECRAV